ncbi:SGNH/GDSL hydrolase family protein, partial [Enterococcus villorum]
ITPMKSTKYIATYNENGQLNTNDVGATQEDYVQAIKIIAQFYSVPVLDMFAQSNMNPFITSHEKWFGDGLHPSNEGYLRIAKQIHHRLEIL